MGRRAIFIACICFITFFDNYVNPPGVRVFDFLGFIVIIAVVATGVIKLRRINKPSLLFYIVLFLTVVYTIPAGILLHNSWSFVPFLMGLSVFLILLNSIEFYSQFMNIIKYSLILTSIAIFTQFFIYIISGGMPSFAILATEMETRSSFAGLIMRPTGFYIEPGSHALASMALLMIYLTINNYRFDLLSVSAMAGVLLSMSFAGALVLFIALVIVAAKKSILRGILLVVCTISAIAGLIALAPEPLMEAINILYIDRFDVIRDGLDGSANDRLGKINLDCFEYLYTKYPHGLLFGSGMTSDGFTTYCGSNNLSWAIFNFGIIISSVFVALLFWGLRKAPLILLALVYVGASGQLSSYMFIWLYFALLIGPVRRFLALLHDNKKVSITSSHIFNRTHAHIT